MVHGLRSVASLFLASALVLGQGGGAAFAAGGENSALAESQKYQEFRDNLIALSRLRLDQPENIKRAQLFLVTKPDEHLSRGWLLNLAEEAAQSPEFAAGVKQAAREAGSPNKLSAALETNPNSVLDIDGASAAKKQVIAAISHDVAMMSALTYRLSEVSYGRTAKEAELSRQAQQQTNSQGVTGATKATMSPKAGPLISQILALSATLQLGAQTGKSPAGALAVNQENDQCLRWAKLNLAQCLAAARDGQEHAYCLAQHGLDERAKCWSWVAQPST